MPENLTSVSTPNDHPFDWLNVDEEWLECTQILHESGAPHGKLQTPSDEPVLQTQLQISGMYCAACALNIEASLKALPGVQTAQVKLSSQQASVHWQRSKGEPSEWFKTIQALGYQAHFSNSQDAQQAQLREKKDLFWRMCVAIFCMMQIMMYSVPTYDQQHLEMSDNTVALLKIACWILSLPIVVFSCAPFWQAAWKSLRHWQMSMDLPVALGMAIAFLISSAATLDTHGFWGQDIYFDSFSMFVSFLLFGRWLELKMRERTIGALQAIITSVPQGILRQLGNQRFEKVSAKRLRVDDIVCITHGQTLPCDGVLLDAQAWVEEALLSGESAPIEKHPGQALLMGSTNLGTSLKMRITQVGQKTRFSQILALLEQAQSSKPALVKTLDQASRPFLAVILILSVLSIFWYWPQSPSLAMITACTVLVVTCPCALTLSVPAALMASLGALARQGTLIKNSACLEIIPLIDTVVFDKTGTLTHAQHALKEIHLRESNPVLSKACVLALSKALTQDSRHPLSQSLQQSNLKLWLSEPEQAEFEACLSALKCLDRLETPGEGIQASFDLQGQTHALRLGSHQLMDRLSPAQNPNIALSQIHIADEHGWLCAFHLDETLKPQASSLIEALMRQHLNIHLLSGDQAARVQNVAKSLKLHDNQVQASMSPSAKLAYLKNLQSKGHRVMMVGDGFNDLPILSGSDVSVVFANATHNALTLSDCVILSPHLESLLALFDQSKRCLEIIRQNLIWSFAYNLSCIPLALLGWLSPWQAGLGMTLSSLLVVLNALRLAPQSRPTSSHM